MNSKSINNSPNNSEEDILLSDECNGVVTLTLNKPAKYNPLSNEMLDALNDALMGIKNDANVRMLIIAANGKAFCAGHDLKQMMSNREKSTYNTLFSKCSQVMLAIRNLQVPVLAKVNGIATAAGCQLVANCDLAIASLDSRFAVSGINVGLFCSTPAIPLSRNVSVKRAFQMLMTGDFIDASTAVDWGLVNVAVPVSELDEAVDNMVNNICSKSKDVIELGKKTFYEQLPMTLADAYEYGAEAMSCNMMMPDTEEGINAFIEKRKPNWKN